MLGVLGDISVDQTSDGTLYYVCEKFKLFMLQGNMLGVRIVTGNDESTCEVKYGKMF